MMASTVDSPNPVPLPISLVVKNGSKILSTISLGIKKGYLTRIWYDVEDEADSTGLRLFYECSTNHSRDASTVFANKFFLEGGANSRSEKFCDRLFLQIAIFWWGHALQTQTA